MVRPLGAHQVVLDQSTARTVVVKEDWKVAMRLSSTAKRRVAGYRKSSLASHQLLV